MHDANAVAADRVSRVKEQLKEAQDLVSRQEAEISLLKEQVQTEKDRGRRRVYEAVRQQRVADRLKLDGSSSGSSNPYRQCQLGEPPVDNTKRSLQKRYRRAVDEVAEFTEDKFEAGVGGQMALHSLVILLHDHHISNSMDPTATYQMLA